MPMDTYTHVAMFRVSVYIWVYMGPVKGEKYSLKVKFWVKTRNFPFILDYGFNAIIQRYWFSSNFKKIDIDLTMYLWLPEDSLVYAPEAPMFYKYYSVPFFPHKPKF